MIKGVSHVLYHVAVVALSAAFALSLPVIITHIATNYLAYWSLIENEKVFLVSIELAVAILLILFFRTVVQGWKDRKLSRMARSAGLVFASQAKGFLAKRRSRRFKERMAFSRDVMIIGSTGYRTFADPEGELHQVLRNCREARVLLLDPFGDGTEARPKSIADTEITPESFREQIMKSIDFLKGLKALQKNVRLKLYPDVPLLKLTIIGDYLSIKHYHPGLDVKNMPEFIFRHGREPGGLFTAFYQYFLTRWDDPALPEYELETDELIYRDRTGAVIRREPFGTAPESAEALSLMAW